ncbi:hypothetical protein F0562_031060 [Nyssa sinensis]|uniref:Uncharacterized protein n=1 Tax=Nyssa sinensis TaxID=561372 RepID=A0A5J5AUG9_9ASTE|nr:hypothetical protein F0562_031060 [Nyssa sinensis]
MLKQTLSHLPSSLLYAIILVFFNFTLLFLFGKQEISLYDWALHRHGKHCTWEFLNSSIDSFQNLCCYW